MTTEHEIDSCAKNKWEHISERALDILIDHLNTLNDLTPKIRTEGRNGVDPELIFGLDSKLYLEQDNLQHPKHHDEVETVTIYRGSSPVVVHAHAHDHVSGDHTACSHSVPTEHEQQNVSERTEDSACLQDKVLQETLAQLSKSKETVWRVKGFVRTAERGLQILNWAFGRYELTAAADEHAEVMKLGDVLKLTVMGERGEVKRAGRKLAEALGGGMY